MAEKKIGGREFKVGVVLATDAIVLKARLLKLVGGSMAQLPAILSGAKSSASEEQKNQSNAAAVQALAGLFAQVDPSDLVKLLQDILALAVVKRPSGAYEDIQFDVDFNSQNLMDLYKVALFVLSEVFGDFLSAARATGNLQAVAKD